ncbi:MAG: DUF4255 domain-containing protein [Verrucomicrobiales bacterium]|nr:DUF4255 domain-containing protein [Verrucomicrobiales bacterium]
MATKNAITTVSTALLGLLSDARPRPGSDPAFFKLYQAKDFATPLAEGISLFLYRVTVNLGQRNQISRPGPNGAPRKRALPLDLHYLLTPWASNPERQQQWLGLAMRTLEDHPILGAGFLNNHFPTPGVFRPDENVELVFDSMNLTELFDLWDVLKPNAQVSVGYVARMVCLESEEDLPTSGRVQHRDFDWTRPDPGA